MMAKNFNSVFDTKPLDQEEARSLEQLLSENFLLVVTNKEQVATDITNLKQITAEIKAIGKQGIILIGERVHRAREILKPYKDGTFTKWLESAFGSRKSGYNALSYYELYTALPHDDLRDRFKKLKQRTAYILASREGDIETKTEIINKYHDKPHEELLILIQEKLPISIKDKRSSKSLTEKLLIEARRIVEKLYSCKADFTHEDKNEIYKLKKLLDSMLTNV